MSQNSKSNSPHFIYVRYDETWEIEKSIIKKIKSIRVNKFMDGRVLIQFNNENNVLELSLMVT